MTGLTYLSQWPAVESIIGRDPGDEARIAELVAELTLEEKVGQMIQPELAQLTPEDVRDYKIGSALNGAGTWPGGQRHAGVDAWRRTIACYREAAADAYRDRPFTIPFLWATDAVHGHNNVYGATIFPHNIGLGAARDPDLVRRIGAATARELAATGIRWTFAPTVTTPRDCRWGRYYEGYSEDPEIVHDYARAMVLGLQGDADQLHSGRRVIATVKHWVADGATVHGADRGVARCSEELVRNIHAVGFIAGIEAGAQAVMASFSSWEHPANYDPAPSSGFAYDHKVHGSRYLLTDVLKGRIGFDGIVISDWDAHAEVAGCTIGDAGPAILAGLDVLMVAGRDAWRSVYRTTVERVQACVIPMSRIDDAVTRILRVKMRAGLWEHLDEGPTGPATGVLGCREHQELAREAARKSLVLLKNARRTLPLPGTARVLVAGSGAAEIQKQTGGWTLSWQGDDVDLADLPGASTVAMAVAGVVGPGRSTVDPWLEHADPAAHDIAVVVIGEDAYAEMRGTIKPWRSIAYAELKPTYARDLATLRALRAAGTAVVTVLLTGRPLYVTEEINLSDAFVVAWLPGPQGVAVTDLLFAARGGGPVHDFHGRLANSWPARKDSMAVNRIPPHIPDYRVPPEEVPPAGPHAPLFPYGSGLTLYGDNAGPADRDLDHLPLHDEPDPTLAPPAGGPIEIFCGGGDTGYRLRIGGHHTWSRVEIADDGPTDSLIVRAEPVPDPRGGRGVSLRFKGFPAFVYAQADDGRPRDLRSYRESGAEIVFEVLVLERPAQPLYLACHDDYPAQPGLDLTERLNVLPLDEWTTLRIPLTDIASIETDLRHVDVPFMLYTAGRAHMQIGAVRWL